MLGSIRWRIQDRHGNEIYLSQERWEHIINPVNIMTPAITYDEISDTLYVSFAPGEVATGIELNDHLLLRINKQERRAVGLTFFDYSLLAQSTDFGSRSFPLTGLADLPRHLHQMVVEIISHPPASDFLSLSFYTPSFRETLPITSLHPMPFVPI